jgi:type II secretory pathway pseudopilin PulG
MKIHCPGKRATVDIRRQEHSLGIRAFSLVDVVVAMCLIGITLVGMLGGLSLVLSSVQWAREQARATQLMEEKLDTLRLYSWDQLNTPGFITTNFVATYTTLSNGTSNEAGGLTYSGNIIFDTPPLSESYSNELKQVTVDLQWTSGGRLRRTQMSTFVARYGMQTYIY